MTYVLIASDSKEVREEVRSVLHAPEFEAGLATSGQEVTPSVQQRTPALVVMDLQMGTMGGMAACLDLRLENSAGRLPYVPVLLLLDRRADVFLAKRARAQGWVVKPLDPIRLRKAIRAVLAGDTYADPSYSPSPIAVGQ